MVLEGMAGIEMGACERVQRLGWQCGGKAGHTDLEADPENTGVLSGYKQVDFL